MVGVYQSERDGSMNNGAPRIPTCSFFVVENDVSTHFFRFFFGRDMSV